MTMTTYNIDDLLMNNWDLRVVMTTMRMTTGVSFRIWPSMYTQVPFTNSIVLCREQNGQILETYERNQELYRATMTQFCIQPKIAMRTTSVDCNADKEEWLVVFVPDDEAPEPWAMEQLRLMFTLHALHAECDNQERDRVEMNHNSAIVFDTRSRYLKFLRFNLVLKHNNLVTRPYEMEIYSFSGKGRLKFRERITFPYVLCRKRSRKHGQRLIQLVSSTIRQVINM